MEGNHDESNRCIDIGLKEMNFGNYEKAVKFLKKANSLYPSPRATELIDLITKLRSSSNSNGSGDDNKQNNHQKSSSSPPSSPRKRKQNSSPSKSNTDSTRTTTNNDFTNDQYILVQKVKKCKTFYEVLNVTKEATDSEIKKAYKKLALQLHPDKNHAPGAVEAFKTVGNAVAVLTDARKRKEYDALSVEAASPNRNHFQSAFTRHHNHHSFEAAFERESDISAEELFNMFFGGFPAQRRYAGGTAAGPQRSYYGQQESGTQPSLAFGLILVLILISMLSSILTSDPVYSLLPSSKYPIKRETQNLAVPYYVRENFQNEYQGSLVRLENSVEEDYIFTQKQNCYRETSYQELDELIDKLKATSISADTTTSILTEISATTDPKVFDKFDLADSFLALIKAEDANIQKEAAKCIAEITKSEVQRKKFTKRDVIETFIDCLKDLATATNMELPIQICRALGNICYLNDEARDIIMSIQGDERLMQLLDIINIVDKPNESHFIKVRGGLISNYLLGGENLAKRAMELKIMQKIQNIIDASIVNVETNEELLLNTLPILSILTENVADLNFEPKLNIQLSRILAASTNPDLAEMCLELLHYQSENDDVKLLLAKDGLCETIYNLLEKYKNLASTSEARALMKLACELIVLILTGDQSMHYLYSTPLLKNMEDWLDSTDIDLLTTGVLALGNFARTDSHCIYMVENKIMNKLLEVLSKNNGVKDDIRLQHALLSALRNLVIPKPNKGAVIQAGLVETILPMLEIHQPPVVFKLLGTLRMTVDGQEKLAMELLKNRTLIEQLVHWSKSSDYAGVTGESLRLMAWLIKHAYLMKIACVMQRKGDAPESQCSNATSDLQQCDKSSLKAFIDVDGTVESMVNMLASQHLVMQNEALIALCILSVLYLGEKDHINLQDLFIQYELGKKLAELIAKSSDIMTKEIVENLQNFTTLVKSSEKLVKHLDENNINELLKSIPILTEYCTI